MGSVFLDKFVRRQRKERKEKRQTESEVEEGWVMYETYHAICLKRDSFFLPFHPLVLEVIIHSGVQQVGSPSQGFFWAPQPTSSDYWSRMGRKEEERK